MEGKKALNGTINHLYTAGQKLVDGGKIASCSVRSICTEVSVHEDKGVIFSLVFSPVMKSKSLGLALE